MALTMKTVLITGCSSGIGLTTAALLAKVKEKQHKFNMFKVYATMRNLESKNMLVTEAGDTLDKTLFIRELDVTKDATIKTVLDEILRENGRVDVLVNNAGCLGVDAIDQQPLEWCQDMMDINYWGVVRATRAVLPAMKKQKAGRILNVTSMAGLLGSPFKETYAASKFAVEGFSVSIAPILRDGYNIRVSIVEPGPVQTEMTKKFNAVTPEETAKDFDPILKDLYLRYMEAFNQKSASIRQSADEIAKLLLDVILSENPHLRYQTSDSGLKRASCKLKDPTTDALLDVLKG